MQQAELPGYLSDMNGLYCAISGTEEQLVIGNICYVMDSTGRCAVLTLNRSDTECISRNGSMHSILPEGQTWSEDWIKIARAEEQRKQWAAEAQAELLAGPQSGNSGLPPLEG